MKARTAMKIIDNTIPKNSYNRPGTRSVPKKICIHYEGNPGCGAANAAAYQLNVAKGVFKSAGSNAWTSSQYVVGINGEIIRCVPDAEIAYAAANNNAGVLHVEVCHANSSGVFSSAAINALSELIPYLMKKYCIPADNVVRHYDLTGKHCPLYYVNNTRWAKLKAAITAPKQPKELAVGDSVVIIAPYAPSAYSATGTATAAIGQKRYITQIYKGAAYPYRVGVKKGDNSTANTTGFVKKNGLKRV